MKRAGDGTPLSDKEYTINPRPEGGRLDAERFVVGSDGRVVRIGDDPQNALCIQKRCSRSTLIIFVPSRSPKWIRSGLKFRL